MKKSKSDKIIKIIVKHATKLGWDEESLDLIIQDINKLNSAERVLFANIKDVVEYYLEYHNNLLIAQLNEIDITKLKIRQRIRKAILTYNFILFLKN